MGVFFVVVFSKIHQKSFLKRGMWDRVHHCFALLTKFFFVIKIKYRNLLTGYFFFFFSSSRDTSCLPDSKMDGVFHGQEDPHCYSELASGVIAIIKNRSNKPADLLVPLQFATNNSIIGSIGSHAGASQLLWGSF